MRLIAHDSTVYLFAPLNLHQNTDHMQRRRCVLQGKNAFARKFFHPSGGQLEGAPQERLINPIFSGLFDRKVNQHTSNDGMGSVLEVQLVKSFDIHRIENGQKPYSISYALEISVGEPSATAPYIGPIYYLPRGLQIQHDTHDEEKARENHFVAKHKNILGPRAASIGSNGVEGRVLQNSECPFDQLVASAVLSLYNVFEQIGRRRGIIPHLQCT